MVAFSFFGVTLYINPEISPFRMQFAGGDLGTMEDGILQFVHPRQGGIFDDGFGKLHDAASEDCSTGKRNRPVNNFGRSMSRNAARVRDSSSAAFIFANAVRAN